VHDVPSLGHSDLEDLLRTVCDLLTEPAREGRRGVNARMDLLYSAAAFTGA